MDSTSPSQKQPCGELIRPVCLTRSAPEALAGGDKGWGRELGLFFSGEEEEEGVLNLWAVTRQKRNLWSCRPKDSGFREGGYQNPDGEDGMRKRLLVGESCNFGSRANRRGVVKIYVQYSSFEGTGALKTRDLHWVRLGAAAGSTQGNPAMAAVPGGQRPRCLRGGEVRSRENRGTLMVHCHQDELSPFRQGQSFVSGQCCGSWAGMRGGATAVPSWGSGWALPWCQRSEPTGKECHAGYLMLSWRWDWAYQAG